MTKISAIHVQYMVRNCSQYCSMLKPYCRNTIDGIKTATHQMFKAKTKTKSDISQNDGPGDSVGVILGVRTYKRGTVNRGTVERGQLIAGQLIARTHNRADT